MSVYVDTTGKWLVDVAGPTWEKEAELVCYLGSQTSAITVPATISIFADSTKTTTYSYKVTEVSTLFNSSYRYPKAYPNVGAKTENTYTSQGCGGSFAATVTFAEGAAGQKLTIKTRTFTNISFKNTKIRFPSYLDGLTINYDAFFGCSGRKICYSTGSYQTKKDFPVKILQDIALIDESYAFDNYHGWAYLHTVNCNSSATKTINTTTVSNSGTGITYTVQRLFDEALINATALTTIKLRDYYEIDSEIFKNCTSLTSIALINSSVSSPGSPYFLQNGCLYKVLNLPGVINGNEMPEVALVHIPAKSLNGVTTLDLSADDYSKVIYTDVDGKTHNGVLVQISSYAVANQVNLTKIIVGDTVRTIEKAAFYNCPRITTMILPFCGRTGEIDIANVSYGTYNSPLGHLGYIFGDTKFTDCYATHYAYPTNYLGKDGTKTTYGYPYYLPNRLAEVTINGYIRTIDTVSPNKEALSTVNFASCAFCHCGSIKKLYIKTANLLGGCIFEGAANLQELQVPFLGQSPVIVSSDSPEANPGFWMDFCFTQWFPPAEMAYYTVSTSNAAVFYNKDHYKASIAVQIVNPENTYAEGKTYARDIPKSLKKLIIGTSEGEVPESVRVYTAIGTHAVAGCNTLETVVLNTSIQRIDEGAFKECSELKNVEFYCDQAIRHSYTNPFISCPKLNVTAYKSQTTPALTSYYLGNPDNPYLMLFGVPNVSSTNMSANTVFEVPSCTTCICPTAKSGTWRQTYMSNGYSVAVHSLQALKERDVTAKLGAIHVPTLLLLDHAHDKCAPASGCLYYLEYTQHILNYIYNINTMPGTLLNTGIQFKISASTLYDKASPIAYYGNTAPKDALIRKSYTYVGRKTNSSSKLGTYKITGDVIYKDTFGIVNQLRLDTYKIVAAISAIYRPTNITICPGIKVVEENAFRYCNLTNLKVPNTITTFYYSAICPITGDDAFGSEISSTSYSTREQMWNRIVSKIYKDGCYYLGSNSTNPTLLVYVQPTYKDLNTFIVANTTTAISYGAFCRCSTLSVNSFNTRMYLPDSVKSVPTAVNLIKETSTSAGTANATALKLYFYSDTIPSTWKSSANAFIKCRIYKKSDKPHLMVQQQTTTNVCSLLYPFNDNFSEVTIPYEVDNLIVTSVSRGAFDKLLGLTKVTLSNRVSLPVNCFNNTRLQTLIIDIADEITGATYSNNAFKASLTTLQVVAKSKAALVKFWTGLNFLSDTANPLYFTTSLKYSTSVDGPFTSLTNLESTATEGITTLKPYVFVNAVELTAVDLPNVTSCAATAFSGASNIESLRAHSCIFDNIYKYNLITAELIGGSISNKTFAAASKLQTLYLPASSSTLTWKGLDAAAAFGPEAFTTITDDYFKDCTNLRQFNILDDPSDSEDIYFTKLKKSGALALCKRIDKDKDTKHCIVLKLPASGPVISFDNRNFVADYEYIIKIAPFAFSNCTKLQEVRIYSMYDLDLDQDYNNSYNYELGRGMFAGCSNLQTIYLPFVGRFSKISDNTEDNTEEQLKEQLFGYFFATANSGTQNANNYWELIQYDNIYHSLIPNTLTTVCLRGGDIGNNAFENCTKIGSVIKIHHDEDKVGSYIFKNCGATLLFYCSAINEDDFVKANIDPKNKTWNINSSGSPSLKDSQIFWNYSEEYITIGHFIYQIIYKEGASAEAATIVGYTSECPKDTTEFQQHECIIDGNKNLKSELTIPANVSYDNKSLPIVGIGNNAFKGSKTLQKVILPTSCTEIGASAFEDCTGLTEVNSTNNTLIKIGSAAFSGCINLNVNDILSNHKGSLTNIGNNAFYSAGNNTDTEIEFVSAYLTGLGAGAFQNCKNLTKVDLSSELTAIYTKAFSNCINLSDFTIRETLTTFESDDIFAGCTKLDAIKYTGNLSSWLTKRWTGNPLHSGRNLYCAKDESGNAITPPTDGKPPKIGTNNQCYMVQLTAGSSIRPNALAYCNNLIGIKFNCNNAGTIKIPMSAFSHCPEMDSFKVVNTANASFTGTMESYLIDCPKLTKVDFVPELINQIDLSVIKQFVTCSILPDSTKQWSLSRALDMPAVTSLTITPNIRIIRDNDENLIKCKGDTTETLALNIAPEHIPFIDTQANLRIKALTLKVQNTTSTEASTAVIPAQAFKNCEYLNTIKIEGDGCVAIEREAFWKCLQAKNATISFDDNLRISKIEILAFDEWNQEIFNEATSGSISYSYVGTSAKVIMKIKSTAEAEDSTVDLNSSFFTNNKVLALYPGAAQGCSNISSLSFEGSKVQFVADSCFEDCTDLTNIVLSGILRLERDSFKNCTALTNISNVSSDLQYFDLTAFEGCTNLIYPTDEKEILKFLTSDKESPILAGYVATAVNSETQLEIPAYVKVILPEALKDFPGHIKFSDVISDEEIEDGGFPSDETVLTSIGDRAFYNCLGLTSIKLPKTMTYLSKEMFLGCRNLFKLFIPKTITTIDMDAFKDTFVETIYYNGSIADWCKINFVNTLSNPMYYEVDVAGKYTKRIVFNDTAGLISDNDHKILDLSDTNITKIPAGLFYGHTELIKAKLPESLVTIEDYAFCQCKELLAVSIGTKLEDNSFNIVSNNLTYIGIGAFKDCGTAGENAGAGSIVSTNKINIQSAVPLTIADYAFQGYANIVELKLGTTVRLDDRVFSHFYTIDQDTIVTLEIPTKLIDSIDLTGVNKLILLEDGIKLADRTLLHTEALTEIEFNMQNAELPQMLQDIDALAFKNCPKLENITDTNSNNTTKYFVDKNCIIYRASENKNYLVFGANNFTDYPEDLVKINDFAFAYRTLDANVTNYLPATIYNLGKDLFKAVWNKEIL